MSEATALALSLRKAQRRQQAMALLLALPLVAFLVVVLVVPIGALLMRAVENPEVADALPRTGAALADWDRRTPPAPAAFAALSADLAALPETAAAGALARRLNSEAPGSRSLIMGTYRSRQDLEGLDADATRTRLIEMDERWGEMRFWQAIAKNSTRWTPDYLLTAVDLRRTPEGEIDEVAPNQQIYRRILARTFEISLVITLWCLALGYPLAWWLASLPARKANMLLILVLVPFWTSILVRMAAWIVLLQREGLVNKALVGVGVIAEPLTLLFNRAGVVISMVHIMLPFMILPLYSVMKSVPTSYHRAAVSLGSTPLAAFFRVYVPQTYPGIGAGALLVFILSLGYYITPALLGGADDQMISYYIARYTNVNINWGMASALGGLLLAATLVLYAIYRRVVGRELSLG